MCHEVLDVGGDGRRRDVVIHSSLPAVHGLGGGIVERTIRLRRRDRSPNRLRRVAIQFEQRGDRGAHLVGIGANANEITGGLCGRVGGLSRPPRELASGGIAEYAERLGQRGGIGLPDRRRAVERGRIHHLVHAVPDLLMGVADEMFTLRCVWGIGITGGYGVVSHGAFLLDGPPHRGARCAATRSIAALLAASASANFLPAAR